MSKPKEYWKKRFEQLETASNSYAREIFHQIEPAFNRALREIESQIQTWYARIAINNKVSIQEARKLLSANELKEFKWDVNEYIKYGKENKINHLWMKELENTSAKVHISRLEALKIRTQQAAEVAFGNELDSVDMMARNIFTKDYYHTIFELQKGFEIAWNIGQIDERKLEKIIVKPWAADGKNFSDRIWESRTQLVSELHNQLTRTCILGKAPDDAISAISKKFKTSKSQAGRLVMTEQAYFHSVAQQEAFNDLEVEEFEIVATLDTSTSEICRELDGKVFSMKHYQVGVTAPPFHPWCRSVTAPYFADDTNSMRAMRSKKEKTEYISANIKYNEWYDKYVAEKPVNIQLFGEKKIKLTLSEEGAIRRYKSPGEEMYQLNRKLRENEKLTEEEKEWSKNLDSLLKKMPYYKGEVSRCLTFKTNKELNEFLYSHAPGKIMTYEAYTSVSTGELFNEKSQVILKIHSTKARDVRWAGLPEDESIYERGCKFKVIDVYFNKEAKIIMELEEVND